MHSFAIFIKDNDDKILLHTKKLINSINKQKYKIFLTKSQATNLKMPNLGVTLDKIKSSSFIVSIGGDGTMLRCARTFAKFNIPIIGINLGRRGFLTEIKISQLKKLLKTLFMEKYTIDQRMMLDVVIKRAGKKISEAIALNDVVIGKNGIARIIHLKTFVNEKLMTSYAGDGLIISTPTGSTGHNLSANGPIIDPTLSAFVITAICPLAITNRPIVVNSNESLKIVIEETPKGIEAILTIDGQSTFLLKKGDEIFIKESEHKTKFIRIKEYNFFTVLKEKLNWSK